MLFNSIEFAIFLPIVFVLYWFVLNKNLKLQNLMLLVASYIFYGWWDWRFLSLLFLSSIIDFTVGVFLDKEDRPKQRKFLLSISLVTNLGMLGFFKYYNFFVDSFVDAFTLFGKQLDITTLNIVLPVGISFYTFQTLSYTIDVYRKDLKAAKDLVSFLTFVSFFPQLVAGPIERATNLLPQFYVPRKFDYSVAADGMRQILWGLFSKIVIADNCAIYANEIFATYENQSGSTLLLGAFFFAFQIYGDFSGYSNIAIGTSKLFGFGLMRNFAYPYFSRDAAEFWRRWHISLSTWFRDYLYIPLGGSKGGMWMKVRNTFIIFLVSGFWHGANWTFVAWGFINACYFLPLLLTNKNRVHTDIVAQGKLFPSVKEALQMMVTFLLTLIAWVFFRSASMHQAIEYLGGIFSASLFSPPAITSSYMMITILSVLFFVGVEWLQRDKLHALQIEGVLKLQPLRWVTYIFFMIFIFVFGNFNETEFIYFAF